MDDQQIVLTISEEHCKLCEEVAARQPMHPDFSDEWIASLAEDLSKFTD